MPPLLQVTDLRVRYPGTAFSLVVEELSLRRGECVGVLGPSGSGKSTLLRAIKGLVPAEYGSWVLDFAFDTSSTAIHNPTSKIQNRSVALIYQQFHLVGRATVYENILVGSLGRVPSWRAALGVFPRAAREAAVQAALEVGLGEQLLARADRISGGQQQRVAIARAILQRARLVLADEPVASLDPETGRQVLEVLLLISLHDPVLARLFCSRLIGLRDGRVVLDLPASQVTDEELERLYRHDGQRA
jgi:phosphonate transport system ATP-binding protein